MIEKHLSAAVVADIAALETQLAQLAPTPDELRDLALERAEVRSGMERVAQGDIHPHERAGIGPPVFLDRAVLEQPDAVLKLTRGFGWMEGQDL